MAGWRPIPAHQELANRVFARGGEPDFQRDRENFEPDCLAPVHAGQAEVVGTRLFRLRRVVVRRRVVRVSPARYALFVSSLANGERLTGELAAELGRVLPEELDLLELTAASVYDKVPA